MPRRRNIDWPPVTKVKIDGKEYWKVDARIGDGKNGRRYYRQVRAEADAIAEQLRMQREHEGDSAFLVRTGERLQLSADTRRRISEANRANFAEGRLTGFKDEEYRRRISLLGNAKLRGSQQFGQMRRGLPTHARAKIYKIEAPDGSRHLVSNLDAWCRQNEALFPPDAAPCVQPLWQRAANGLRAQAVATKSMGQWRGWRLVAIVGLAGKKVGQTINRRPADRQRVDEPRTAARATEHGQGCPRG